MVTTTARQNVQDKEQAKKYVKPTSGKMVKLFGTVGHRLFVMNQVGSFDPYGDFELVLLRSADKGTMKRESMPFNADEIDQLKEAVDAVHAIVHQD